MLVQDWYELDSRDRMVVDPWVLPKSMRGPGDLNLPPDQREYSQDGVQLSAMTGYTGMINGRGRSGNLQLPLTTVNVTHGETVRLCVVNVGAEFAWQISIDNHVLTVLASDGYQVAPVQVEFVTVEAGETVDIEVTADQEVGSYWFRSRTLRTGVGWHPRDMDGNNVEAKAIFRYVGADSSIEPTSQLTDCTANHKCRVFNCNFQDYAEKYHRKCVHYTDIHSTYTEEYLQDMFGIHDTHVVEYFLNFAFPVGSSVNARRFLLPSAPLSTDGVVGDHVVQCEDKLCDSKGCACTYILDIPRDKTIQIVLANLVPEGQKVFGHHPIHIHGTSFAVMATGYPDMNSTTGHWTAPNPDILCENRLCAKAKWRIGPPTLNTVNPIIKDTIVAPARGYTVIRFRSTNPGYWFAHCHAEQHVSNGMNVIFNIGPGEHPPLPADFPACSNFDASHSVSRDNYPQDKGRSGGGCPHCGTHFSKSMKIISIKVVPIYKYIYITYLKEFIALIF